MENMDNSTDRMSMNRDTLAGQWKQLRGTLKSWWGKLTDDDFERIAGHKDRLIGMIQEKYGYTRDMAQREVDRRLREHEQKTSGMTGQGYVGGAKSYQHDESTEDMGNAARQTAQNIGQSASNMMSDAKTKAQEMGSMAANKAGEAVSSVGEGMSSLADSIRQNAPSSGTMGSAVSSVANQLDAAGSYLQDVNMENITQDLTALIRRYPLQSLLVGLGIGYLLARSGER